MANDLLMLATLFRRIQGESTVGSEKPFRVNPCSWLLLPDAEKSLRLKPTAERYEILMKFVDRVDPSGQLRLALAFARWHGRRVGAISSLKPASLRLTTNDMLETLRAIAKAGHQPQDGIQGSDFAYEFLHGAIYYAPEHDKKGFRRLVPLSSRLRAELDLYLSRHPGLVHDGPLFPRQDDATQSTRVTDLITKLHEAEALARSEGFYQEVPELYDSAFHGYRGLRATEMEDQGHRDAHVDFLVGWTCKTGSVKRTRYVTHSGKLLFAAVEGLRPIDVDQAFRDSVERVEEENGRLRDQNSDLAQKLAALTEQNAILTRQLERMGAQLDRLEQNLRAPVAP